jgi:hypothetical protein
MAVSHRMWRRGNFGDYEDEQILDSFTTPMLSATLGKLLEHSSYGRGLGIFR